MKKQKIFIPPCWGILIFALLLALWGLFCYYSPFERKLIEAGKLEWDFHYHPLDNVSVGAIGIFLASTWFTVTEEKLTCHFLLIFFRRIYWPKVASGVCIRGGEKDGGSDGKLVVYLILQGTKNYDPETTTIKKYASRHPWGVIKIVIRKKAMEQECLEAFSSLCPNFRILSK